MSGPSVLIRLIRALSIDIVAGGLAGAAFAAHLTGARLPGAFWEVLPAAIWVVYTLDHLLDARRVGPDASNDRHVLHARHEVPLALAAGVVGGLILWRAFALPRPVIVAGACVAVFVALYFSAVRRGFGRRVPREVPVAAIYVAGLWLGPLALAVHRDAFVWTALVIHAGIALNYLFGYAWFEAPMDAADRSPSVALAWGRAPLARAIHGLALTGVVASLAAAWLAGPDRMPAFLALAVLSAVPWAMLRAAPRLVRFDRYRHAEWLLLLLALPVLLSRFA